MALNTLVNITLIARDWETVIGIIDNSAENDLRALKLALINYYFANGNPSNATPITIATKEKTLVKIFEALYGNTVKNLCSDNTGNVFNRVIAAIRAANNVADNYITTSLAAIDTARTAQQLAIRKNGREILMMENFDNS
jgi:hypothetical protein